MSPRNDDDYDDYDDGTEESGKSRDWDMEPGAYFGLSGHLFRFHPARRFGVIRPA